MALLTWCLPIITWDITVDMAWVMEDVGEVEAWYLSALAIGNVDLKDAATTTLRRMLPVSAAVLAVLALPLWRIPLSHRHTSLLLATVWALHRWLARLGPVPSQVRLEGLVRAGSAASNTADRRVSMLYLPALVLPPMLFHK